MKMSRAQLYRRIDQAEEGEWESLKRLAEQSPWRQKYHIQPVAGLLNDPNGFAFMKGISFVLPMVSAGNRAWHEVLVSYFFFRSRSLEESWDWHRSWRTLRFARSLFGKRH